MKRYLARHSSADEQGKTDAVAVAELEQKLGLERALDVHVQLGLGQAAHERDHGGAGSGGLAGIGGVGHTSSFGPSVEPLYPLHTIAAR